jgi:alkaline phosphatase D
MLLRNSSRRGNDLDHCTSVTGNHPTVDDHPLAADDAAVNMSRFALIVALCLSLADLSSWAAEDPDKPAPAERSDTPVVASGVSDSPAVYLDPGPMVGHVSSSNALIWARASDRAELGVRVGRRPDLSDGQVCEGPKLDVDSGFMGTVAVSGLEPAQTNYYCLLLNGRPAMLPPYPSFKSAPPESQRGRVRVAFTSCVGYHGYDAAPGYSDMATRTNVDLVLMLGDNHYANTNGAMKQREYYYDQRRTGGWRELSASTPIYAIWDDHDYGPDNSDGRLKGKEESLKTFKEHWANPAYGEEDNPGVYFTFSRAGVDFFMLDVRYHRDPNKAKDIANKTMLGAKQVAWLKRELLASRAPVKVLASGGEWQSNGTDDSWTSFARERDEILGFIDTNRIKGVLLLSGDRHFTAAYHAQGKWIEVTSGPLGSSNARSRNLPEMFLNFSDPRAKFYCIYDINTAISPPDVTLEVYCVGEGLALRREFTWDEIIGLTKITPLPPTTGSTAPGGSARRTGR